VNFPPFYWEEILFRAGVEPLNPITKCSEKTFTSIVSHTKEFVEEIKTPTPVLYSDGTYSIIPLRNRKEQEYEKFSTYSELMDKIYSLQATQEVSKVHLEKQEKIQRKLYQQKKHLEELLKGIGEKQKTGNLILEEERQLNSVIEEYKRMKKSNKKLEEIEKRLSELFGSQIKLEKGKITFEV
jgi:predicted ribosome quality control (RQC) complex YloA/Tae2 family protein